MPPPQHSTPNKNQARSTTTTNAITTTTQQTNNNVVPQPTPRLLQLLLPKTTQNNKQPNNKKLIITTTPTIPPKPATCNHTPTSNNPLDTNKNKQKKKEKEKVTTATTRQHYYNPTTLILFVFFSCIVPLSTPSRNLNSSSHPTSSSSSPINKTPSSITITAPPPTTTVLESFGRSSSSTCKSATEWIEKKGSFCFSLRESPFLRNLTELELRESRAVAIFCELDEILERVDCGQPYSVNVNRDQCQLCREAYRDWACAMTSDTLQDGRIDCDRGVMPCASCASICHQVMRLCPYLTPDRVQFDETGAQTPHVSQYGGHPAFYCPLENTHANDPALYTNECPYRKSTYSSVKFNDEVHNLCAAGVSTNVTIVTSTTTTTTTTTESSSVPLHNHHHQTDESTFPNQRVVQYSTCCWTYSYSLVHYAGTLENYMKAHTNGYAHNRVILNCCDDYGACYSNDPQQRGSNNRTEFEVQVADAAAVVLQTDDDTTSTTPTSSPPSSSSPISSHSKRSSSDNYLPIRTANNQVLGKDGKSWLNNDYYVQDEGDSVILLSRRKGEVVARGSSREDDDEDDDEEYYEDVSSTAGEFPFDTGGGSSSSHGSSGVVSSGGNSRFVVVEQQQLHHHSSTTTPTTTTNSIHRDNKYVEYGVNNGEDQDDGDEDGKLLLLGRQGKHHGHHEERDGILVDDNNNQKPDNSFYYYDKSSYGSNKFVTMVMEHDDDLQGSSSSSSDVSQVTPKFCLVLMSVFVPLLVAYLLVLVDVVPGVVGWGVGLFRAVGGLWECVIRSTMLILTSLVHSGYYVCYCYGVVMGMIITNNSLVTYLLVVCYVMSAVVIVDYVCSLCSCYRCHGVTTTFCNNGFYWGGYYDGYEVWWCCWSCVLGVVVVAMVKQHHGYYYGGGGAATNLIVDNNYLDKKNLGNYYDRLVTIEMVYDYYYSVHGVVRRWWRRRIGVLSSSGCSINNYEVLRGGMFSNEWGKEESGKQVNNMIIITRYLICLINTMKLPIIVSSGLLINWGRRMRRFCGEYTTSTCCRRGNNYWLCGGGGCVIVIVLGCNNCNIISWGGL